MKVLIIGLCILLIGGILFPLFKYLLFVKKENNRVNSGLRNSGVNTAKNDIDLDDKNINKVGYTQDLLDFDSIEICNDNVSLLQVNEDEYIAYLEVKGVSYNLLSLEERLSLEENYGNLLNGIDFPFQVYVQSRSLNLDLFLDRYKEKIKTYKEKVDKIEKKLTLATTEKEKNAYSLKLKKSKSQLQYGYDLLDDFKRKNIDSKLLERRYYIVLKYFHNHEDFDYELSHKEIVEEALNNLATKASNFTETLGRNNLECHLLNGIEIAELLYNSYNKEDANYFKIKNAIKAKYNHICTTSLSIEAKKIDNEIEKCNQNKEQIEKDLKHENELIQQYEQGIQGSIQI